MSDAAIAALPADQKRALLARLLQRQGAAPRRYPLSFAQRRLWFLDRMEPGSTYYNMPAALELRGTLDVGALERAIGEIVRRHDSLRIHIELEDGEPVQVVTPPPAEWRLPVDDLAALDPAAREAELARIRAEGNRPFALDRGPLFRVRLVRMGEDEHLLVLNLHHTIVDGWSMGVFATEMSEAYDAFLQGKPSPLAPLTLQYGDFAAWQRKHLEGPALEARLAYWRRHLEGAPALLPLPTDRPRPAVSTHQGARTIFPLTPELTGALKGLARREGVTLFMVLLAAYKTLLARWAGEERIVVGVPIAGRTRGELEPLIGCFVNTLALRTDLDGDPTFRELLARVRETTLGGYAHQDLPFEKLVEELHPERSLAHAPVFQTMFNLTNVPVKLELAGITISTSETDPGTTVADLNLTLAESRGRLMALFGYSTELFEAATIERMFGHFVAILEAAVADPGQRISRIDLLDDAERRRLLEEWSGSDAPYPRERCIHELVEDRATRSPESEAVLFGTQAVTRGELEARANRIAHTLRAMGVGPEVRVGVCLERTPDLLATLLAVLRAGGAYVPLDPAYPTERLGLMLEDAGVSALVTRTTLAGRLREEGHPAPGCRVLLLDADAAEIDARPADPPRVAVDPANLAYLIYTSGSTGRPKGVAIEHRAAVALLAWTADAYASPHPETYLAATSVCFDISVFEIFHALAAGHRILLVDNVLELIGHPRAAEVTLVNTVPSAAAELAAAGAIPAGVRTLNLAGEAVTQELAARVQAPGRRVFNLYGPSEDTTYSTFALLDGLTPPTIGRTVWNSRAYVLDARGGLAPAGVVGELFLGGAGVSRGYLGRPALTAERYLPDPFSEEPGARLYRTGDRVRWLPAGELDYLGRADHQVKVRGFRVEPGEIEAALAALPDVREAAVVVHAGSGGARLVAYVAPEEGRALDPAALRGALRTQLPDYMVPAAFVVLERLPLNANGKIDRRGLPAPDAAAAGPAEYAPPRTAAEQTLAAAWAEILEVPRVGLNDGFFELGGHSLMVTRVVSRLRREMGVEVPLRTLFEAPTLAAFAARVEALLRDGAAPAAASAIRALPRRGRRLADTAPIPEPPR